MSFNYNDYFKSFNASIRALQSYPEQVNASIRALQNYPEQVNASIRALQSYPEQVNASIRTLQNYPEQVNASIRALQNYPFEAINDYLKNFDIDEITTTLNDYLNLETTPQNSTENIDEEALIDFIEFEMNTNRNDNNSFRKFISKIVTVFGIKALMALVTVIFIPYLFAQIGYFENHQIIIDTLQETLNSLISSFGDEVIAMATVRDVIEEQNLSDYEHLNLIGILRVDTFIRKGSSKNAPLAIPNKLKANTIVNLLELNQQLNVKRKKNWLKVNVKIEDDYVEGWIEESKVQRFKKVN